MALEVRVPKEITEYNGRIALGLTGRQLVASVASLAVGIPIFLALGGLSGNNTASSVVLLAVLPIIAFGFVKIKGYPLEKYIYIVYRHRFTPAVRLMKTGNPLSRTDNKVEEVDINAIIRQRQTGRAGNEVTVTYIPGKRKTRENLAEAKREIRNAKIACRAGKAAAARPAGAAEQGKPQ